MEEWAGLLLKMPVQFWKGSTGQPTRPLSLPGGGGSSEAWSPAEGPGAEAGFYIGDRGHDGRMEPIRSYSQEERSDEGPRVKPQKPKGLKLFSMGEPAKRPENPQSLLNLDPMQGNSVRIKTAALSPVDLCLHPDSST